MTRTKKIIGLSLIGLIIGFLMVPKTLLYEAVWSSIESGLASNGIVLRCNSPRFSWRSVSTADCQVRYKAFGVELERAEVRLVGVFPPTAQVNMRAFNEDCEILVSEGRIDIPRCGFQADLVPQLAGLGFTNGRVTLLKGNLTKRQPRATSSMSVKGQVQFEMSGSISASGISHPTMTTSRLGIGSSAPVVIIPAFEDGAIEALFSISPEERRIEVTDASSSLFQFSGGTFIEKLGALDGQSSGLRGSIGMKLTPAGTTQFGPLLDGLAQPPLAEASPTELSSPHGGAYQVIASGTLIRPSFRVLKSR